MNKIDLVDRCAIVTGGSSGIGFATAARLASSGATVALWGVNRSELDEACAQIPGGRGYRVDVTDAAAIISGVEAVASDLGRVDILVCSAGIAGERHLNNMVAL